jgi:hypothetical protein
MYESTYSTPEAARDADEYFANQAILEDDPHDPDAAEAIARLDRQYGAGFFEDDE